MRKVKGVILAGGEGKRFRPLSYYFQKCMIPVGSEEKPILEYIVRLFSYHKIKDLVLLVGYKHQQIENYFNHGERFGVNLRYVLDDPKMKGSANAILNAYRRGDISKEDTLLVYYGDIVSNLDLTDLVDKHMESGAKVSVALAKGFKIRVGTADLKEGWIMKFIEKPEVEKPVSIGVLVLDGSVIDYMEKIRSGVATDSMDLMGDVVQSLVSIGEPVRAYVTEAFWYDVGSIERYERMENPRLSEELGFLLESEGAQEKD